VTAASERAQAWERRGGPLGPGLAEEAGAHHHEVGELGTQALEFLPVRLSLGRAHIAAERASHGAPRALFRFHEDLEVRLRIRLIADFRQQEGIDVASGGDEIQVAANPGLPRMNVAKVVHAVDNPVFLVAGREIEDLLLLGKDDQRREPQLCAYRDNVFLRVLHNARRFSCGLRRRRHKRSRTNKEDSEDT